MAAEHVSDPNMWDDCVQEALIHTWLLRQKNPGRPEGYYNKAARRRIIEVAKTGFMTGMPRDQGKPVDPMRHRTRIHSLDAPVGEGGVWTLMDTIHDYDRDREVVLSMSPIPREEQEFCKSGKHRMAETRMGQGKGAQCGACKRERARERRIRMRQQTERTAA